MHRATATREAAGLVLPSPSRLPRATAAVLWQAARRAAGHCCASACRCAATKTEDSPDPAGLSDSERQIAGRRRALAVAHGDEQAVVAGLQPADADALGGGIAQGLREALRHGRSEEHTSELQSLMPNSYAVYFLKKKTNTYIS